MKFVNLSKDHEEEVESEGTWAISYGDMITLLLSFFVIFFTTDFDKKKMQDMGSVNIPHDVFLKMVKSD
jgi:flagellar motor protein MotB